MSLSVNFPVVEPSLVLDFANSERLDPRITFTRTTTATYYDGVTTAKAEENLVLQSQDFTTTWANNATTDTANTEVAPDGTTTADTVAETTDNNFHVVFQSVSSSGTVTFSVFAKLGSGGTRFLTMGVNRDASNYASATFDLSLGTVTQTVITGAYTSESATITAAAQSYYRCTLTVTTDTVSQVRTGLCNTSTPGLVNRGSGAAYVGNTGETVILWGAQLEQRSAVTAYTPTTTQPITNYIPVLLTAAAGQARFDHNPTTSASLGLLVEEQRTNLLLRSEEFDNAAWSKTRATVTANNTIAPNGTTTADKLVEDSTASNTHLVEQTISGTSNTNPYTFSVYAKAGERSELYLRILEGSPFTRLSSVIFNLSNGTSTVIVNNGGAGSASSSITPVGNGWYRCTLTTTLGGSATSILAGLFLSVGGSISYTGNGFDGIYIWGAQLEVGAFPTSYIPTVASTMTRNADLAAMTGANFSSWYSSSVWTMYCSFSVPQLGRAARLFAIDSGDVNNMVDITISALNGVAIEGVSGGVYSGSVAAVGTITANTTQKIAVSFSTSENELITLNGSTVQSGNITNPAATLNTLRIGHQANFAASLNGSIQRLAYYPLRLSNAQLQALTA